MKLVEIICTMLFTSKYLNKPCLSYMLKKSINPVCTVICNKDIKINGALPDTAIKANVKNKLVSLMAFSQ